MNLLAKPLYYGKKYSPEILLGAGLIGGAVTIYMACKATLKVDSIVRESAKKNKAIETAVVEGKTESDVPYSPEDGKHDGRLLKIKTAVEVGKAVAPVVVIGASSVACVLSSYGVIHKRNVALSAGYSILDASFKDYRRKVIERFGPDVDRELKYDLKKEIVQNSGVDEEGNTVVTNQEVVRIGNTKNGYIRFFSRYVEDEEGRSVLNPHWKSSRAYNLTTLMQLEDYCNVLLRTKKILTVNEVDEILGFKIHTKEGQVIGWRYDPENPTGDNRVNFGIRRDSFGYAVDQIYGENDEILIEYNVDGYIWDYFE